MSDRLTQLQDAVNVQADNFCNSIGILQQLSNPSSFHEFEKSSPKPPPSTEDHAQNFATLIARTAKEIDILIESLPNEDSAPEVQAVNIRQLEQENQEAARRMEEVVERGERLLEQIRRALHDIAHSQLEIQKLQDVSKV